MLFFRGFRGLGLAALLSVVGHAQIMNAVRVGQWTRGGTASTSSREVATLVAREVHGAHLPAQYRPASTGPS